MKTTCRQTFREIVETSREEAAVSIWERARLASRLRHAAAVQGNRRAARCLSKMQQDAVRLAAVVAPELLNTTIDSDYHVGLVSVRFEGHGRLHLPADFTIENVPKAELVRSASAAAELQ
jgi:hypothetical protein